MITAAGSFVSAANRTAAQLSDVANYAELAETKDRVEQLAQMVKGLLEKLPAV